ncbi:hypothetical protein BDR03DRAFT_643280 [Suillus americanus]|nr:hypothetical protein BDR03DRAFT_643280 [Suillus americanus]
MVPTPLSFHLHIVLDDVLAIPLIPLPTLADLLVLACRHPCILRHSFPSLIALDNLLPGATSHSWPSSTRSF